MLEYFKIDLIFYGIELIFIAMLVVFCIYKENKRTSAIIRLIASSILAIIFIMRLIIQIKMNQPYFKRLFFILIIIVWCANIIREKNILNSKDKN